MIDITRSLVELFYSLHVSKADKDNGDSKDFMYL